jgi:hypothetical protein
MLSCVAGKRRTIAIIKPRAHYHLRCTNSDRNQDDHNNDSNIVDGGHGIAASRICSGSAPPIFLDLTLHSRRIGIFDLDPMRYLIGRSKSFADDALTDSRRQVRTREGVFVAQTIASPSIKQDRTGSDLIATSIRPGSGEQNRSRYG